jgi:hypothetical protein
MIVKQYYSERTEGSPQRILDEIPLRVWKGIVGMIDSLSVKGAFGLSFPDECPDGSAIIGTDSQSFFTGLELEHPYIDWSTAKVDLPPTNRILDLIEFCFENVADPIRLNYHYFYGHDHLRFNKEEGQVKFAGRINRMFERNGLAYVMGDDGGISRILPEEMVKIMSTRYRSGDAELDKMIDQACSKIIDTDPEIRKESLEKLWDAWERTKTLLPGDKKASINALLDRAATEPNFRNLLEIEALQLKGIGNDFMIRHTEVGKTPIADADHIDYLFHRLFAMIHLILKRLR